MSNQKENSSQRKLTLQDITSLIMPFSRLDASLPVNAIIILLELAKAEEAREYISVLDLSRISGVSPQAVSRTLATLSEGGTNTVQHFSLIQIRKSLTDGRRSDITLTAKGRSFLESVKTALPKQRSWST